MPPPEDGPDLSADRQKLMDQLLLDRSNARYSGATQQAVFAAAPPLLGRESTPALDTFYLDIDAGSGVGGGTAVYVPGPGAVRAETNVLLWFHGNKSGSLTGNTVRQYLKDPRFDLRKFVTTGQPSKTSFVLVVPPLDNSSNAAKLTVTGGAGVGKFVEELLDRVMAGLHAYHLNGQGGAPALGNLVVAAHSGGYKAMANVVETATTAVNPKLKEVWCMDCTYGEEASFRKWATDRATSPGHSLDKLWVYSTGRVPRKDGTDGGTGTIAEHLADAAKKQKNIQVYDPSAGRDENWVMPKLRKAHDDVPGAYLPLLVTSSAAL